ncbi:DMT family transporter [Rhizobium sp. GN54]|uniref:DMT family transporter n=1 Tax=Rhizobium sp. GN54 TaxID=2898150 RepID=UPI001E5335FB|nr:DMT family transporter [Rhizobium sp. GN54]MCD2185110.1 DMT family transporter [Rhizobium sp. GN54]
MSTSEVSPSSASTDARNQGYGATLVLAAAIVWSFGGMLARLLDIDDGWTVIFWRSLFAALFLLVFMLLRDGVRGTWALFAGMGLPGLAVGLCFATASTSFILALAYTTVANVVLIQASVPLIAALMCRVLFGERIAAATWVAIAAVILGVGIMVSGSITGRVSPLGDALALLIAFAFATATVVTRRFSHVRMTPAVFTGTAIAGVVAASQATGFAVTAPELGILVIFGALNFGLGLALFVTGARLIPSALAALLGTAETVLAPLWVALFHGEVPGERTVVGGAIVLAALLCYLGREMWRQRRAALAA